MSNVVVSSACHVVPVPVGKDTAAVTPPWFVNKSEYKPHLATYRPLVNGEEAFGEVYRAIAAAKKTVCIICWGFQPSMYFVRDGTQMMIGQLLEKKAREDGVMVRVLCWAYQPTDNIAMNLTGVPLGLDESNTPGRWMLSVYDKPDSSTDAQYEYDKKWYRIYDRKQPIAGELNRRYAISDDFPKDKLLFTSRSYLSTDKEKLGLTDYDDKGLSDKTKSNLKNFPSHHQKVVVIDHEDPKRAVGFVMGHNMLDSYWDSPKHSYKVEVPNRGRNGSAPWHDYSSRVTGPIIGDLFRNFVSAWQRETGQSLPIPAFESYPLDGQDDKAVCQILRTQPQYGRTDIKACYLQAVGNATQYIAIENQYFRWPPLANKIKESVTKMLQWGRSPEKDGPLYLFVITNSTDKGMGVGTVNTYRMLDSLGRADRIPEVARNQRLEQINKELDATNEAIKPLKRQRDALDEQARLLQGLPGGSLNERYAPINEKLGPLEARKQQLEARKASLEPKSWRERTFGTDREPEQIKSDDVTGLKVQIATLVSPDTPAGMEWPEVYIHAKLMMIDDTFMTAGSANINTRSMQTDSEMNIAHHRPEITAPLRSRQWDLYTGGQVPCGTPLDQAFARWGKIMEMNGKAKRRQQPPVAQLCEFLRTSDKISNSD
jgi:phosphatidylserine/phosphatidylglycerophosphate/cardiolipin synthase-like enzyme